MHFTTLILLALTSTALAWPHLPVRRWGKRQTLSQLNDVDILRYALTLEHLEDKFYREGLVNFTQADFANAGFDATFYANLQEISADETNHVGFLTSALNAGGNKPTEECIYAFGITSVTQFVGLAKVLEGVGVSAYLGAAAQISNKAYLTAAGSILTIEARHNAYLRASISESPFPQPYDEPLTPDEVHTLAHTFIVSCPSDNPTFPIKAFPGLTVTTAGALTSGQQINVQTNNYALAPNDANSMLYAAFVTARGPLWTTLAPKGDGMNFEVTIPVGVNGQSYLVFSDCNDTVSDRTVVAGPALMEISNSYNMTGSGA